MRNLFWILLLGNVILFAVMQRGGLGWEAGVSQVQPELHPDMIRMMPVPQSPPAKAMVKPAVVLEPPPPAAPAQPPAQPMLDAEAAKPDTPVCLEWGDFSGPDLARATEALAELQLADRLSQRLVEHEVGYWVYMPPLRNRAAVNRKIAELKALGVREYFVVQGAGTWRNAISLGVFKTHEAAQNFLHMLNAKGVRTARVGERVNKIKSTLFILNSLDAATEAKLTAMQKDFAGSELNKAPCGLTR